MAQAERRTGPVATIRIMKGLSYRVGSYQTHRVTADELTRTLHIVVRASEKAASPRAA